ncbi:MAG: chemotaxis protein CheB [Janthinobacterium lividum]
MPTSTPNYIIAIGASAGGLEEINTFFDHTPLDSVSYVIVQHLSPDFKSRMVELLSKHSKLKVKEAENGMLVRSNEVYLIPNNKFMTICDNMLFLTYKEKVKGPHLTVNRFFNSLAADCGKKAIAVVLSGLGSDGTEGVKAINKAGGMIIARNPETSEFGSMPSNAIATGVVDFILEPAAMPDAIEEFVKYKVELLVDQQYDEKNVAAIIDLIRERLPLDFSGYKQSTILRRIKRRAAYHNFTKLEDYSNFLVSSQEEIEVLAQDFLISVTSFFRDKKAFEFLQSEILPSIIENHTPGEELKLWVAGCATGEEAYSMAILVYRQLQENLEDTLVKIFATDIDAIALAHAAKGVYNQGIKKQMSPEWINKYFIKEGDSYRIIPEIRKMVIFAHHDLVKNPPYCNMSMITCRNLLIYMNPALQKKIFNMLLFGLKSNGYLFLGPSENPIPIMENLEVVHSKFKIYKNLEAKRSVRFDTFSLPDSLDMKRAPRMIREDITQKVSYNLDGAVNTILPDVLGYLTICVNKNHQVVKTYGDTTKYLLQKNFNTNLVELLPRSLAIAFNTLSNTVLKSNEKATVSGIKIKQNGLVIKVSLTVSPLKMGKGEPGLLLVTFFEERLVAPGIEEVDFDEKSYHDQYTLNLEEELKELKQKLQSANEKLDVFNENMQSFNEELLSANEEMQSTNEEMQSINEELHTVNADYQLKNKELLELNVDLNNYFRSNINGQLFVDNDLLLMKFSPGTTKQINLLPTDVGRPLSNISTNIKFETITDDIKRVIANGEILIKEIETNNGKWYQVMTMPYIQSDNTRNGAMVTFNDISELKSAQLELNKKNEALQRINADLDHFVHVASHDLLAPLSNIEGSIGIINRIEVANPDLNKFLKIIDSSVKKFSTLVKDIATIAKTENGAIATEIVDLDELIANIEWSLENKIQSSGAVIITDLQVRQVRFSKKNLRSILYNLISNAIKFKSDVAPVIHIHSTLAGDNIIVTVQDNGIGISKDSLHEIFDIYGRLNQILEGQGVGLYLVKKIIDAAGGNVVVESEPGIGSKFMIHFKAEPQLVTMKSFQN